MTIREVREPRKAGGWLAVAVARARPCDEVGGLKTLELATRSNAKLYERSLTETFGRVHVVWVERSWLQPYRALTIGTIVKPSRQ